MTTPANRSGHLAASPRRTLGRLLTLSALLLVLTCSAQLDPLAAHAEGSQPTPGAPLAAASAGAATGVLVVGDIHACGLRVDGTAVCWGDDFFQQASPPAGTFTSLTAGAWHTCGLRPNGTATCWGRADEGQLAVPPRRLHRPDCRWVLHVRAAA